MKISLTGTYTLLLMFIAFVGCTAPSTQQEKQTQTKQTSALVRYAKGFELQKTDNGFILKVKNNNAVVDYFLYPKGTNAPQELPKSTILLEIPLKKLVCRYTTHAAFVAALQAESAIVGISESQFICNENIRKLISEQKIAETGTESGFNLEKVIALQPNALTVSAGKMNDEHLALQQAQIPMLYVAEYLEETPLGKAEWIKFFGVLFDKTKQADSIFNDIEQKYLALAQLTSRQNNKPTVFSNIPYGGTWYMAGGRSFAAQLFKDAGANYVWANDTTSGSMPLGIEVVYEKAQNADFWLNTGNYASLNDLKNADTRFERFAAWKNKKVFNYDARQCASGGNDYWETGTLRPDWVLQDLVLIFYPKLLINKELYFYRTLK